MSVNKYVDTIQVRLLAKQHVLRALMQCLTDEQKNAWQSDLSDCEYLLSRDMLKKTSAQSRKLWYIRMDQLLDFVKPHLTDQQRAQLHGWLEYMQQLDVSHLPEATQAPLIARIDELARFLS